MLLSVSALVPDMSLFRGLMLRYVKGTNDDASVTNDLVVWSGCLSGTDFAIHGNGCVL